MRSLKIEYIRTDEIIPYENNPRINEQAVDKVANSIEQFGFKNPIIIDKDNIVVAGHTRLLASQRLGLHEVPTIRVEDLSEDQIRAYRIADNKVSEYSEWDYTLLENELNEILSIDMSQFGFDELEKEITEETEESLYTMKIETPVYEITGEEPSLEELVDHSKTDQLITAINAADIPDDVREFLIRASYRHLKFNYSNIAEYYAHAPKEIQELMEDSALVIIDFKKAIELGYVKVSEQIEMLREEDDE